MLASALRLPSRGTQAGLAVLCGESGLVGMGGCLGGGALVWGGAPAELGWPQCGAGAEQEAGCVSVPLPHLYQCHPSLAPVPVPCLLSRKIPVLQLPAHMQETAFPVLEAAFLCVTALPILICSLGLGTWTCFSRLPLGWHPHQIQVGSTLVFSHSCPHPHYAPVMTVLRGASTLG